MYKRIRELREDKDLNQTQLGKILNVSQVTYSYYEIGKRDIPVSLLIELAYFYNTSIDYLVGITNEQKPYTRLNKKQRV